MTYNLKSGYKLIKTPEYQDWLNKQIEDVRYLIAIRLARISKHGYFGNHKHLDDEIWELKWQNGRRVYYASIAELNIVLLLGGNKNDQSKDTTQAKKIFNNYKARKKN